MSMNVTYKMFRGDTCIREINNNICYSHLFRASPEKYSQITHVEVKIKTNSLTKPYKYFWLYLIKRIEPSFEIKDKWIKVGGISHGKMKIILTILRFLWEDTNHYDEIVPIVFNILMDYPDMDPLKAIYLGNSIASNIGNEVHSLVNYMADKLPTIEDYRTYSGDNVYSLTYSRPIYPPTDRYDALKKLKDKKQDLFDYKPAFEYYGLK